MQEMISASGAKNVRKGAFAGSRPKEGGKKKKAGALSREGANGRGTEIVVEISINQDGRRI